MIRRVGYYVFISWYGGVLLSNIFSFIECQLGSSDEPEPVSFIPWSLQTGVGAKTRETVDKDHIFENPVK